MPETQEILSGLNAIASNYWVYAICWHIAFYVVIFALVAGWVPSNRLLASLICLPLFSVAILAWLTGNPFNGTLFSIMAILTLYYGPKTSGQPVGLSRLPFAMAGMTMIIFGLVYPHFMETGSVLTCLYASPVGLIPCPTLSVLIGFALLYNGFGSKPVTLILLCSGLFYGLFGVLKLAVYPDLFLVSGSLVLLTKYLLTIRK
ncbi:MAG: hypothetical protein ACOH2V_12935 [Candidatus Saccharimonadaceae bacterium]